LAEFGLGCRDGIGCGFGIILGTGGSFRTKIGTFRTTRFCLASDIAA
jgi:hypothetical protein